MKTLMISGKLHEVRDPPKMFDYVSEFGTSHCTAICPFCKAQITIYPWSFAGCGRNCTCGAKLSRWGSWREIKK